DVIEMMMNQGGNTDTLTSLEPPNSLEKRPADVSQAQTSSYLPSTSGYDPTSWGMHGFDNSSVENGTLSNSTYHQSPHQQPDPQSRNLQDGQSSASIAGNPANLATTNLAQDYNGYGTYPSSNDPYSYSSTGYEGYYSGYNQQSNHSYSQQVGTYQSTGAAYQPYSSFQNTGSYTGPASYTSTYYSPPDCQTSGGYPSSCYSSQTNLWNNGNYPNYTSQPYSSYTPDTNSAYASSTATSTSLQYQQQYKQWVDYYNQTEVSCAPGTENLSATSASNLACPIPSASGGYPTANVQPQPQPQPQNLSWRPESHQSELPTLQPTARPSDVNDNYWKHGAPGFQNHVSPVQPQFQWNLDTNQIYGNSADQQKTVYPQGNKLQYPVVHQVSLNHQPTAQNIPPLDTRRMSKLQIPTNPRIASNLPSGILKTDKGTSASSTTAKPAYIGVSLPKPSENVLSNEAADSMFKPGAFPPSLRGYVERALARCKDDSQMAASQAIMKEMITKATADGTLCTRNWDTEPLFPLPNVDNANKDSSQCSMLASALPKYKRSPSRRSKSRWEPISEEKSVEKAPSINLDTVKSGGWFQFNDKNKKFSKEKSETTENASSNTKFTPLDPKNAIKNAQKLAKRRRLGNDPNAADNSDASSDSDKERGLTAYYAAAMALANSPEERKRRESRSKRFEKVHGSRSETNNFRQKMAGSGNMYTRRASALVLSKNFEDGGSRAVEDIDWDSLTIKGTCQEIEKRYLRLTSAPDPATVRPEDVLEKALLMVQNSQKNYLYKCDQLKSIRQDLTVQRVRNAFTAKVYETHARLAIGFGDIPEYNQCQSQLKTLYADGIEGCAMEFSAYNLLCVIMHSSHNRDLLSSMSRLSDEAKKDEAVKHALAVRAAVTSKNYVLFFRLYKTAPNLNACLMDLYVEKIRYEAIKCMSRSYRPTVPVSYIAQVLGFTSTQPLSVSSENKDADGFDECVEWLKAHGACLIADNASEMQLDTKASSSSLYMPEPDDAVAHGDANLAVNDFLTRAS
ncbi:SAC3/GANP/THP3, conserved domain, partial [Dillenia turbinata]